MPAILRIFSGLHLGAEIELTEGIYVIGTDDSCDLILSESSIAARHAALRVTADHEVRISAEALDGSVFLNGAPLLEEDELPPMVPFQIGLIIAAWLPADTDNQASVWAEVEQKIRPQHHSAQPGSAEMQTKLAENIPSPSSDDNAVGLSSSEDENQNFSKAEEDSDAQNDEMDAAQTPHRVRDLSLIAAIILAGTLCFTWKTSPENNPEQIMRTLLDEAGYHALNVMGSQDSVVVSGRIATDRERGRLLRLAQLLEFPVYFDVTVHSDAADAVRASFNTLGLWPEVTELPPSARPGVRVRGYIKNGVLEQQALSNALRNIPDLRPTESGKPKLEIFRNIKHEEDVQALLTPALTLAGLNEIQRIFLPGRVELRGTFTPQSKTALEDITAHIEKKLGVPVPFDIINDAEVQTVKTNIYMDQRSADSRRSSQSGDTASSSFRVVSVSMGAMKFATLENGERVFEGGELPGGYVLERISVDELTLSKNGSITPYPLRGGHE